MKGLLWLEELETLARERPDGCLVKAGASLARCSTLRIGGPAEALVEVSTMMALQRIVEICRRHRVPLTVIGRGANLLFPDHGLRGVVCRLLGEFAEFEMVGTRVRAGAGVLMAKLARACAAQGLVGLEALAGFPASVGGAVVMNAGCYGTEVSDWLVDVDVLVSSRRNGESSLQRLAVAELRPGYRTTVLKGGDTIVLAARFELEKGDSEAALARLELLNRRRWQSLPSGKPNAGSIFRNPAGEFAGRLLERAGVKGLQVGGAAFSEKHANVIVNLGEAKASEVLELIQIARQRVQEDCSVHLELELLVLGDKVRGEDGADHPASV